MIPSTTTSPSDLDLLAAVAATISVPRASPANSFQLHAQLELCARAGLLAWVDDARRGAARERIAEIAELWTERGPAADAPVGRDAQGPGEVAPATAAARLAAAIDAGDIDEAELAAIELARSARPGDLAALLGDAIVSSTAAAGHAPILLHLLPRVAPHGELPLSLLRPPVRELARYPDWRIGWFESGVTGAPDASDLFDALAATPRLGPGESSSIHPTMMRVDDGVAAATLHGALPATDVDGARRAIQRVAAASMLQEPTDHAPYGWSHCLTMPQGVLSIAGQLTRPDRAIAVAATHVVGFRASLATEPLRSDWEPGSDPGGWRGALDVGADEAAAAVWHHLDTPDGSHPGSTRRAVSVELASRAAAHRDAHQAKYVLATLDAAADDPAAARLYLSAAAKLVGLWSATLGDGDRDH